MPNNRKKAVTALILATLIWASTYAVAKIGLEDIAPFTLALIRGVLATIILLIFSIAKREIKEVALFIKTHFWAAILLGLLGMFLLQSFQNFGLKYSSSIMGGVLINASPIFILFLSVLFLKESNNKNKVLGIILGFAGITIMTLAGADFSDFGTKNTLFGNTLLLGVALCWAAYSVVVKKLIKDFSPFTLTLVSYIFGTLLLLPVTLMTEDITLLQDYNLTSWAIIIYLGIFGSAASYLLWNYGVKYIEVSKASIYQYLSPTIAVFIGFIFLHEQIDLFDLLGILLIFSGIYISERHKV